MTNSIRKLKSGTQHGASTLILTLLLLSMSNLLVVFAGTYTLVQQKISANEMRTFQVAAAAEAGIDYGTVFLQNNSSNIIGSPLLGTIANYTSSNTSNVSLANGSVFSITYSNPIPFNYDLIQLTSTASADNENATRILRQQVYRKSLISSVPAQTLASQGAIVMSGNANLTNYNNLANILTRGEVVLSGNATTTTILGGSNSSNTRFDITKNSSSVPSASAAFFSQYFNTTPAVLKNNSGRFFTTDFANASGVRGTSIWIDQSAIFGGSTSIGTAANPVMLYINGSLNLSGDVTIYGFVFVNGAINATDYVDVIGAIASTGSMTLSGNVEIKYSSSVLNAVKALPAVSVYVKVPGSWKDF